MLLVLIATRQADGNLACTVNGSASFLKIPRISLAYPLQLRRDQPSTQFSLIFLIDITSYVVVNFTHYKGFLTEAFITPTSFYWLLYFSGIDSSSRGLL